MGKADSTLETEKRNAYLLTTVSPPSSSSSSYTLLQLSASQSETPETLIMARRRNQRRHRRRREGGSAEQANTPASPPTCTHFFKIVLSHTLESGKLGIPKSFLRRYGKDLSSLVFLKVPGGSTWPVKLEKVNSDMVWLWQGWRKFMEHYSIAFGHLIVFRYEGDSIFHVIIFDKSASEINYPLRIASDVSSPEGEFPSQNEENIMEIKDIEGSVPCSWPSSNGLSQEFGVPKSLTALQLASTFKSDFPFFKVVVRPSYVKKAMVKLRSYEHRHVAHLSIGWPTFVKETGLHVRDVCVFELIDSDNIVFRVSIFSNDGQVQIKHSQCQESSSEPAFHNSPFLLPVTAHEKANKFKSEHPFFKVVILPSHINRYLKIPWEFIQMNLQEKSRMATLVYSGRSWEVNLQAYPRFRIAKLVIGWSAFATEACLREGDVCVFELIERDDIVFRVSIFSSDSRTLIKHSQCVSPVTTHEKAHKFKSEHPFFHFVILPKHINRRYLNIPWKFIKTYIREDLRSMTLVYSGLSWDLKLLAYPHYFTASLTVGWSAFAREAQLREGDFCVFELVDKDNYVLRVSIFRSVDEEVICIK